MNFSEKWGKDIKTATDLALRELKASIDEVKVTVLEEPSKGFLGIGSKLALVRVEKLNGLPEKEDIIEESVIEEVGLSKFSNKNVEVVESQESKLREEKEDVELVIKDLSNKFKHLRQEANSMIIVKDKIIYDNRELHLLDEHKAIDFLKETTQKMGIDLDFIAYGDEENLLIQISGKDSGTIIGKRGQTLDAIQYLTSLVVNKNKEDYLRVILDAENYRAKREKTLKALADRIANKVVKTGRSVKLEPMNPYERMIIHSTLQNNDEVVTRSEGEEPYRRIVIDLKK